MQVVSSPEKCGAFLHVDQTHPRRLGLASRGLRVEAPPVVANRDAEQAGISFKIEGDAGSAGVLLDVAERFLDNAVEIEFGVGGQTGGQPRNVDADRNGRALVKLGAQAADGGSQTQIVEFAWPEIAGNSARLVNCLLQMSLRLEGVAPGARILLQQTFFNRLKAEFHRGENLDDAVVEFTGHSAALGFLGFADEAGKFAQSFLRFLPTADVARDDDRSLGLAAVVEDPVPDGLKNKVLVVVMPKPHFNIPVLAALQRLLPGLPHGGTIVGVDQVNKFQARQFFRDVAETGAMRGAGVDEPAVDVQQSNEVARVFSDKPVLLLTSPKRGLGAELGFLDRLLLECVGDRGGKAL